MYTFKWRKEGKLHTWQSVRLNLSSDTVGNVARQQNFVLHPNLKQGMSKNLKTHLCIKRYLAWQKNWQNGRNTSWAISRYMNTCERKLLRCIKKSKSELAGAMFGFLSKPLFRDLHEKLHQAFGELDWQVDIYFFVCFQICLKLPLFCCSRICRKFRQKTFCLQGGGDSLLREDAPGDFWDIS